MKKKKKGRSFTVPSFLALFFSFIADNGAQCNDVQLTDIDYAEFDRFFVNVLNQREEQPDCIVMAEC